MPKHVRKPLPLLLKQFFDAHGHRYDYSRIIYLGSNEKVEIVCKQHGPFWQFPNDHRHGAGCQQCSGNKKMTLQYFLQRCRELGLDEKFDLTDITYNGYSVKSQFKCKVHGEVLTSPKAIVYGGGCRQCGFDQQLRTKIKNGSISDPRLKSNFDLYKHTVRDLSNKNYIRYYYDINPSNLRRGQSYHLDHIVSILDGFLNGISEEEIAAPSNLRIIPARENQSKGVKRVNSKSNFDRNAIRTVPMTVRAADFKRLSQSSKYNIIDLSDGSSIVVDSITDWCREHNLNESSVRWASNYQKTPFKGRFVIKKL